MDSSSPAHSRPVPFSVCTTLRWKTLGGEYLSTNCITRDISDDTLYCYLEYPLVEGLPVQFDIVFPTELTGREPLAYRCTGIIWKIEKFMVRAGCGAAISILDRELLDDALVHQQAC